MFAIAAIAAGTALADVTSANIVSYVNHTVQQGQFAMIGVQFEDVTSTNLKLNDFIKGSIDPVECDFDDYAHYETANMIETYLGNDAYAFFYYVSNGWDPDANDGDGDWYDGWVDDGGYKISSEAFIPVCVGCWAKARQGTFQIDFK